MKYSSTIVVGAALANLPEPYRSQVRRQEQFQSMLDRVAVYVEKDIDDVIRSYQSTIMDMYEFEWYCNVWGKLP